MCGRLKKISANQKNRQDSINKEKIAAQRSNVKIGKTARRKRTLIAP